MNKEILNNLKIGEKAVDIQEYYYGENGKMLVYKITMYECVRAYLVFKKIKSLTLPFYFNTKELAERFIMDWDKYDFIKHNFETMYTSGYAYSLYPKEFNPPKHKYYMVSAIRHYSLAEDRSKRLEDNGVWGGLVSVDSLDMYGKLRRYNDIDYTKIFEREKLAAKEGSIGQTFSYKLTEA